MRMSEMPKGIKGLTKKTILQGDNLQMTNRWNQALHNKINKKRNELEEQEHREELNHEIVMRKEKLDEIQEELEDTPLLNSDEEFEEFERKIEDINTEVDL